MAMAGISKGYRGGGGTVATASIVWTVDSRAWGFGRRLPPAEQIRRHRDFLSIVSSLVVLGLGRFLGHHAALARAGAAFNCSITRDAAAPMFTPPQRNATQIRSSRRKRTSWSM